MTREEFIKQRCEIDKITEEEFEEQYRVVKCDCGQLYCKGYRCLDLDDLLKENKKLKDNWNKLKEWLKEYEEGSYGLGTYETGLSDGLRDVTKKMQDLESKEDEYGR